nr:hypothetical protein [Torque teno midi virus]
MQHYPPPKLYKIPFLDAWGKQQQWISIVESQHDLWCGCHHWLAHFLDTVIPLDSKNRGKTIQEIIEQSTKQIRALPALPLCPGDGTGDENHSAAAGDANADGQEKEPFIDVIPEDELAAILENAEKDENVPGWVRKIRVTPKKKKERRPAVPGRKRKLHFTEPPRNLPNGTENKWRPRAANRQSPTAAVQQKHQHPQTLSITKTKTTKLTVSNGYDGVTLFPQPTPKNKKFTGWGKIIEKECAIAFKRPERTYMNDTPIYPWLPPSPKVNFALNFKF